MKLSVLLTCCAVLLAACGSTKPNGHQAAFEAGLKFAKCMRAHGVTDFPDPSSGGGIQLAAGIDPASPSFQAAQKACGKDLPGGPFRGHASAAQKKRMLQMSECMRAHGLANFPDPVSSPPQLGSGGGFGFGSPGAFLAIPQSMVNAPGFKQAAAACGLPGAPPGGGRKPKALAIKP